MITWDEMLDFYNGCATSQITYKRDFCSGMVDLIHLIRDEPEIQRLPLSRAMYRMLIALPDYDSQSIHISWVAPETYSIFLTPDSNQEPEAEDVHKGEVIAKVKEYLGYLNERKLE